MKIDEVFSLGLLNSYIDADCLAPEHVVVLKDGEITDRGRYTRNGRLVPGALRERINDGFTLSVRNVQDLLPEIARVCRGIQRETGYPSHASAYLTPPGARGLGPHWDPYTVVVAQIAGAKTWPVYRPMAVNPTNDYLKFSATGFTDHQRKIVTEGPADEVVTIVAGDTLVVPRGWIHRPYAEGSEPSLHITFAVREVTRYWLAQQILGGALARDDFREGLRPQALTQDLTSDVESVRAALVGYLAGVDAAQLAARAREAMASLPLAL